MDIKNKESQPPPLPKRPWKLPSIDPMHTFLVGLVIVALGTGSKIDCQGTLSHYDCTGLTELEEKDKLTATMSCNETWEHSSTKQEQCRHSIKTLFCKPINHKGK